MCVLERVILNFYWYYLQWHYYGFISWRLGVFPRHSRAKNYQKAMEKSLSPFHCAQ